MCLYNEHLTMMWVYLVQKVKTRFGLGAGRCSMGKNAAKVGKRDRILRWLESVHPVDCENVCKLFCSSSCSSRSAFCAVLFVFLTTSTQPSLLATAAQVSLGLSSSAQLIFRFRTKFEYISSIFKSIINVCSLFMTNRIFNEFDASDLALFSV